MTKFGMNENLRERERERVNFWPEERENDEKQRQALIFYHTPC